MKFKKYDKSEIDKIVKRHRRKQKGLSPFSYLNPDAGDVEKGIEFFNHASGTDGNSEGGESISMGEGYRQNELEEKQKLFQKIKSINPNANFKNYKNMSINKMLAIYNSYNKIQKKRTKKSNVQSKELPKDEDVYFNKSKGDFMIRGLDLRFETEKEAVKFARELRKEEQRNEKEN